MFDLIADSPLRFLLALIIGVATGWWIWARWGADASADAGASGAAVPAADAPEVAPLAAPVAEAEAPVAAAVAAPVAAAAVGADADTKPKIAAAVGADDDLRKIKGIGPKLDELCRSLGVRRFDQIAAWGAGDVAEVDQHLGNFRGRIERDEWIAQAKLLASGDDAVWEAKFGGGTNT